jgi:hypothetical protein
MVVPLSALLISSQLTLIAADRLPRFGIEASCRGLAVVELDSSTFSRCVGDEQIARKQLQQQWSRFSPASHRECVEEQGDGGGSSSYVELLGCLTTARDAAVLNAHSEYIVTP